RDKVKRKCLDKRSLASASKFVIISVLAVFLLGFAGRRAAPQTNRPVSGDWDREGAAKYLDDRMDIWFANAKKLQTGQSETSCVSCHTTIPYVMARPVLRAAMRVNTATPQELRLIEETSRRVGSYETKRPLYDHNESKQAESRGTEAVLNALILASADAAQDRREPSAATQQAFKQLWETQRSDGAWDW